MKLSIRGSKVEEEGKKPGGLRDEGRFAGERGPRVVLKISGPEQDVTARSRQEAEGAAGLTFHVFGSMRYEV